MSRYIDADAFIENLNKDLDRAKENGDIDFMSAAVAREFIDGVSKDIKDERLAPYIDIVRCKECKFWKNTHLCATWSAFGTIETDADDFCSYGEREGE